MIDRESEQGKVADTPDPKGDGVGYRQSAYAGTLFRMHPVRSRQLRESRYVVVLELRKSFPDASQEDTKMPVCGQEDGGSVVAECQDVMSWTW